MICNLNICFSLYHWNCHAKMFCIYFISNEIKNGKQSFWFDQNVCYALLVMGGGSDTPSDEHTMGFKSMVTYLLYSFHMTCILYASKLLHAKSFRLNCFKQNAYTALKPFKRAVRQFSVHYCHLIFLFLLLLFIQKGLYWVILCVAKWRNEHRFEKCSQTWFACLQVFSGLYVYVYFTRASQQNLSVSLE